MAGDCLLAVFAQDNIIIQDTTAAMEHAVALRLPPHMAAYNRMSGIGIIEY